MPTTRLASVKQVMLLFALALCVVAMHHVGTADHMPVTATHTAVAGPTLDEHPDLPDDAHGLLHLCLAVLSGTALLALAALWALARPAVRTAVSARPPGSAGPGRPPDRRGRTVLTSLCVLRT